MVGESASHAGRRQCCPGQEFPALLRTRPHRLGLGRRPLPGVALGLSQGNFEMLVWLPRRQRAHQSANGPRELTSWANGQGVLVPHVPGTQQA